MVRGCVALVLLLATGATKTAVAAPTRRGHHKPTNKAVQPERHVAAVRGGLPNVQALGALVLDENGHELYARNPDHERPIASISKLAATLVVMERGLELEGLSTICKTDIEVARGGARSRLQDGMTLSNRDLLHAALMGSDNRAIPALGRAVKLSPTQLAAAMTTKARELGLKKTRFHDPTGLSNENVSTPRETIVLLQAVMRNPVLGPITERVQYDAHPVGRPPITYVNTYRPAVRNTVRVLGGKTGYNDDARYCLVLAVKVDGRTCYMSFLANEGKMTRFGDVARVADWMISRKPKAQIPVPLLAANAPSTQVAKATPAATARATATGAPAATPTVTTAGTTNTNILSPAKTAMATPKIASAPPAATSADDQGDPASPGPSPEATPSPESSTPTEPAAR
jgi:D-alanyl-D-alanine endopeptidase (penicillin-binding protein 7)